MKTYWNKPNNTYCIFKHEKPERLEQIYTLNMQAQNRNVKTEEKLKTEKTLRRIYEIV